MELIGLGKDWGKEALFSALDMKIEEGEKIGLVGSNGSGKTSLLRILAGRDQDFRGRVIGRPGLRIGLLPQNYRPPEDKTCVEVLLGPALSAKARMEALAESFTEGAGVSEKAGLAEYGELEASYEALGGEAAEELARRLLSRAGLGSLADVRAGSLSGGEKSVLALAAALAEAPELLLLDEPGNHLDFAGLSWLGDFIKAERRAVLMVSHDRALLDACVDRIVELEAGKASFYAGGYSAYRIEKLSRAAGQGERWQAERKKLERLEALVRRLADISASHPDPAWGKRLRARRSQLERERAGAVGRPTPEAKRMRIAFEAPAAKSDFALVVRGYSKAYGERRLFEDAGFDLMAGERAALVGPNGSGKTSFFRDLAARCQVGPEERWSLGETIRVSPGLRLGYCSQEMELFRADRTVGEVFEALGAKRDEAYRLLRLYLFDRSILDAELDALSGGEKSRLQIARAVFLGADFLVLDEPTNHLDIESREALEEGLEDFAGTLLVASHDRWFLERAVDRIIAVEGQRFVAYEGSFAEYWRDRAPPRAGAGGGLGGRKASLSQAEGRRARGDEAAAAIEALERRIGSLELEKERLERDSARFCSSRDFEAAGKAAAKARSVAATLERLYDSWSSLG
jgi:ATPase subunit of ABC transporter with duplicated ATPase domains